MSNSLTFLDQAAKNICAIYEKKCWESYVVRRGTVACGLFVSPDTDDDDDFLTDNEFLRKPELVAEHSGRAALLYGLIKLYRAKPEGENWEQNFFNLLFMLLHDTAEIRLGDQLDDGSASHEEARITEQEEVLDTALNLPKAVQNPFMQTSYDFEHYEGLGIETKPIDKMDAVMYQLFYKKNFGRVGSILEKEHPSERDLRFAKILETYDAPDVWTLHYRVVTKHLPRDVMALPDAVLKRYFKESYGMLPRCMTIDVSSIRLDASRKLQVS